LKEIWTSGESPGRRVVRLHREADDILAQLPRDLEGVWERA
jgi:hypothetical protein